ncbi:MAG: DNA integrity scanning diadenylate cyclase DisA [Coriobacteriia bacterium]|nr:DNA integrity scanning diadenylate cyclase DisA [Coriobacteriia bacterium]MCL2750285.1 DNA integrity scanning diadenylate cyclase DisA [Coriobacteriia bacterium]
MKQIHSLFSDIRLDHFDDAINLVSSGTQLREAIDLINSAQTGAFICIGDVEGVLAISGGGFEIDVDLTPQRLFELSKMDGAILLSDEAKRIICANIHLSPDPNIPTPETGMRHRSASRASAETNTIAIAISKRRRQTTLYRDGEALTLDSEGILLQRCNQGIMALQNYRTNLDRSCMRLSFLEMDDISTVADFIDVINRFIRIFHLAIETELNIDFLGDNSGILRGQIEELSRGLAETFKLIIRDYATSNDPKAVMDIAKAIVKLKPQDNGEQILHLLGYIDAPATEEHISPRGFRTISRISMLDEEAVARIIDEYGSLHAVITDSEDGFDDRMEDLGIDNVRALAKSFMRLRSTI